MLIALVILSLGVSSLLAFEGFRLHRLLVTLGESARVTLAQTAKDMERLRSGRFELLVPIKQDVPVKMRVPFRHKVDVPVKTSIPVCQEVKTTVDVKSLGITVPLEVTVPLDLMVPIEMTVPIEINRSVAVSAVVPIDFSVPVIVELTQAGLGKDLARVRDDLRALEAALDASLATAPKFGLAGGAEALARLMPGPAMRAASRGMANRATKAREQARERLAGRRRPQAPCPDCD